MKRLIAMAVLLSATFAYAYEPPKYAPNVGSYVTNAVYFASSRTAVVSSNYISSHTASTVISSYPVLLHGIFVNKCGGAIDAMCKIYESRSGTAAAPTQPFDVPLYSSAIYNNPIIFDVWLDSGMSVWNMGVDPADITFMYRRK